MKSYCTYDDGTLVRLIASDGEAAFAELYDRYWIRLLSRAKVLLNSSVEAEEVVQDVFVTLWKKAATIKFEKTVASYLSAMLQYACFKRLAEAKRSHEITTDLSPMETADDSTREYLQFEALQKELEAAVSELPEQCQLIFRLSREEGLSDQQIADELDLSVNTVRTQKHRALKKLKTSLNSFFLL
ncbi:MAG: RNA polymerase sigma-70 factor [Sphingobacteriia bacterium]|nr:RNA polymerase sigma-70 factor [Sphingobacteriia bacterium]